jgi:hypothetical protein
MVILESPYDDIELLNKDLMTSSIELNQNIYFQYIKPKKSFFNGIRRTAQITTYNSKAV